MKAKMKNNHAHENYIERGGGGASTKTQHNAGRTVCIIVLIYMYCTNGIHCFMMV